MIENKIKGLVAAAALTAGASAFAGAADAAMWQDDGEWRGGGWPGYHEYRGAGWGWVGAYPYSSSYESCMRRQWVWTPYGWRLEWLDACGYGW
jgi:hypothetical protein